MIIILSSRARRFSLARRWMNCFKGKKLEFTDLPLVVLRTMIISSYTADFHETRFVRDQLETWRNLSYFYSSNDSLDENIMNFSFNDPQKKSVRESVSKKFKIFQLASVWKTQQKNLEEKSNSNNINFKSIVECFHFGVLLWEAVHLRTIHLPMI